MEQKIEPVVNPPIDLIHLKDSLKRKDLQYIISVDPQKLTVKQKKAAKVAGLLALVIVPLFERAKNTLKMCDYDVAKLLETGQYDELSELELKSLQKSAADKLRSLKKKGQEKMAGGIQLAGDTLRLNQMINIFFNQFNLDPSIECLKRQNSQNQIALYQFMLNLPACPVSNFLQMLSEVIDQEEEFDQKLRLFHSFCGLYDGQWTGTFEGLCIPAIGYLASTPQAEDKHALGFLRYAFVNNVDLSCDIGASTIFDEKFSHVWIQLGASLWSNLHDRTMFNYFPETIMMMTQPMIKALKDSSLVAIPPNFFKVALGILTYSHASNQEQFEALLFQFKSPLKKNYMPVETSSLITLFILLEKEMVAGNKLWFKQPKAVINLLETVYEMIKLSKVPGGKFSPEVCGMLLAANTAAMDCLKRPSYKKHGEIEENSFLDDIMVLNSSSKETALALKLLKSEKVRIDLTLFKHLLLTPSPIQEVCIKMVQLNSRVLLCPEAGTGKTTLMNALILEGASQGKQVIVVNPFAELLFGDYVTVRTLAQQMDLQLQVQLLNEQQNITGCICFVTFGQLLQIELPQAYHLVIDEFQEELYSEKVFPLLLILRRALSVTAFSGSPILKEHMSFLQGVLPQSLVIRFPDIYPNTLTEKVPYICMTMQAQIAQISKKVEKHRVGAPVIIIGSEALAAMYMTKVAQKKREGTILLFGEHCNAAKLDQLLTTQNFCEVTNDDSHKVYLALKEGGVGIDYPSTDAINKAGGNVVIVGIEPITHSQLVQFRRRTARMGAPGTVLYVLKGNRNGEDPNYLKVLEGTLKEMELQAILKLSHKLSITEHQKVLPWWGEVLFKLGGSEEGSNEDMADENDDDDDEEEKEHQRNDGINMDDYDVCQLCHGEMVAWQDHVCPSNTKLKPVKHVKSAKDKEEPAMNQKIKSIKPTKAAKDEWALDSEEEEKNDGGAKKDDIEEADDKKKPVEQIQPQKDNRENEEEGKNDIDMEDLTKEKSESNLMVKLKIDGQGIYLKKVDYQAYQEGMETGIGENIPNQEMKEEEEIRKEITAETPMMKPLEQKSMLQGVPHSFEGMITNLITTHSEFQGGQLHSQTVQSATTIITQGGKEEKKQKKRNIKFNDKKEEGDLRRSQRNQ